MAWITLIQEEEAGDELNLEPAKRGESIKSGA